jgi:hypothetical protein
VTLAAELATPYPQILTLPLTEAAELLATVRQREADKPRLI